MSGSPVSAGRRRRRRGSLERPINGRLYRSSLLLLSLPLLILAFSVTRPVSLPTPDLPPNFDGAAALDLATSFATANPDRAPDAPGTLRAAQWFRDQMAQYDLRVSSDRWEAEVPGVGETELQNLWAVVPGQARDAIVVVAHRDNSGVGPGANDNASGTAALVELARGYAQVGTPGGDRVRPRHTLIFLSTDAGAFGGVGAVRFAERSPTRVLAVVNLTAIAGLGPPRVVIAGDTPRSPAAVLVETAALRVLEQTGMRAARASFGAQLVDLGFPLTLYEQGPFVARGIPALTLTTAGERPPDAFSDRPAALDETRLAAMGRVAQELIGSLDQGLELAQGTSAYIWAGDRIVRGWAIELLLAALLIPFFVGAVDLFAHCRRRRIPLLAAALSLRSRLAFWAFVGIAFYALALVGAWPGGAARPAPPESAVAGDWPLLGVVTLAALVGVGWIVARHRLVPRRAVGADEVLAGETVALLALGIVALLVLATNPFALLFILPALHSWLWLPQVRAGRGPARFVVFAAGLVGPLALLVAVGHRLGLGLDAPWYVAQLAASGYVAPASVAIALGWAACGAQLAAATAGRYAPYPPAGQRPLRGPIRETVRALVLGSRARRRVSEERRRAFGG